MPMTTEYDFDDLRLRAFICERLGWRFSPREYSNYETEEERLMATGCWIAPGNDVWMQSSLPELTLDLMHLAEKTLKGIEWVDYNNLLVGRKGECYLWHVPLLIRAKAFYELLTA